MPRNDGCWARSLDNCRGRLTGEHLISVGAFQPGAGKRNNRSGRLGEEITVTVHDSDGRAATRNTTVRQYTRDILCEHHNNFTNDLDKAGAGLIDAIGAFFETHDRRALYPNLRWNARSFSVDALRVERWLMKLAVNNAFGCAMPIGSREASAGWPCGELVEMIFGLRVVPRAAGAGLFHVLISGAKADRPDRLHLSLMEQNGVVAAALFGYRTFLFGVNLVEGAITPGHLATTMPALGSAAIAQPMNSMRIDGTNVELRFVSTGER